MPTIGSNTEFDFMKTLRIRIFPDSLTQFEGTGLTADFVNT